MHGASSDLEDNSDSSELFLCTVSECVTSYTCGNCSALPVPALLEVIKGVWSDQPGLDSLLPLAK